MLSLLGQQLLLLAFLCGPGPNETPIFRYVELYPRILQCSDSCAGQDPTKHPYSAMSNYIQEFFNAVEAGHIHPECKAVNYCNSKCRLRASDRSDSAYHAVAWCSRLKGIMNQSTEFIGFPFSWSRETTSFDFDMKLYELFLTQQGVRDQGLWRFEIPDESPRFGELSNVEHDYVLPWESIALQEDIATFSSDLMNWRSYYELRGFNVNSPICILLQWPLTLYYILMHCVAQDYPLLSQKLSLGDCGGMCNIHIIGVEKEANILYVFEELAHLIPNTNFSLTLIGPSISAAQDGRSFALTRTTIILRKGLYHQMTNLTKPHLVVGFNAGLPAYESWLQTIELLEANETPAYFTDYCWPAVEYTREQFENAGRTRIAEGKVNPFRGPIRIHSPESEIPRLSNGVLFHLVYSSPGTEGELKRQTI